MIISFQLAHTQKWCGKQWGDGYPARTRARDGRNYNEPPDMLRPRIFQHKKRSKETIIRLIIQGIHSRTILFPRLAGSMHRLDFHPTCRLWECSRWLESETMSTSGVPLVNIKNMINKIQLSKKNLVYSFFNFHNGDD